MEFYISPENRQSVEHKLDLMFKHFTVKPTVVFNPVEKVIKQTIYDYGYEGHSRNLEKIQAIKVEISNIETQSWVLVATVDYKNERLLMVDARYFKSIPEQFGLDYTKCDHCGSEHKNRVESHILYNPEENRWMQVGSTCINKMVDGGKYLNGIMLKLFNVISMFGGCDGEAWEGGYWRPSSNYKFTALYFKDAVMVAKHYMDNVSDVWEKPEYDEYYRTKVSEGTNDKLMKYECPYIPEDEKTFDIVKDYFNTIEYGEVGYEKSLTQKIKDAFENEYIVLGEMYLAWFAIMSYKNSINTQSFEEKIKSLGIEKGMVFNFYGELKAKNPVEVDDYMGYDTHIEYDCIFEDEKTGLKFSKQVSSLSTIEKYLQEDGKYKFAGTIKYIAYKRQYIGFGGRLKKSK